MMSSTLLDADSFSYCVFFLSSIDHHCDLHSFPTRRSSDLHDLFDAMYRRRVAFGRQPAADFAVHAFNFEIAIVEDRKSTRLNSSHITISYAVFCLKKKKNVVCSYQRQSKKPLHQTS